MSWTINLISNSLKLSKACATELEPILEESNLDPIVKGKLQFNIDHSEHMDYLRSNDEMLEILGRHNVTGAIRFVDAEGSQSIWEHQFDHGEYTFVQVELSDIEI